VTFFALLLWVMLVGLGGYPMLDETRMRAGDVLFFVGYRLEPVLCGLRARLSGAV
jgi:hypothetical protein